MPRTYQRPELTCFPFAFFRCAGNETQVVDNESRLEEIRQALVRCPPDHRNRKLAGTKAGTGAGTGVPHPGDSPPGSGGPIDT